MERCLEQRWKPASTIRRGATSHAWRQAEPERSQTVNHVALMVGDSSSSSSWHHHRWEVDFALLPLHGSRRRKRQPLELYRTWLRALPLHFLDMGGGTALTQKILGWSKEELVSLVWKEEGKS